MSTEDLPNGFTYKPTNSASFESAADAIRKAERESQSMRLSKSDSQSLESEREGFENGWRVSYESDARNKLKRNDPRRLFNAQASAQGSANLQSSYSAQGSFASQGSYAQGRYDLNRCDHALNHPYDGRKHNHDLDRSYDVTLDDTPVIEHRWSWVEIDLGAIRNNIVSIRRELEPDTMFLAIVKANAYGHGAVEVAKAAEAAGAEYAGVATVDEAVELRDGGVEIPILVLSEPPASTIPLLLSHGILPSISTPEFAIQYAETADMQGMRAPYHLAINTGMNRIGVRFDEVLDFLQQVGFHRALDLIGTFTHFATADSADTMDFALQHQRFEEALSLMRGAGFDPGIVHAANSAAALRFPEVQYDMVRVGLAMYGYYPCDQIFGSVNLLPAMSVHARITQVNNVPVGEGVSYGLLHRSTGFSYTCTIPIGYADGLRRGLSNRIKFIMGGRLHPQVGLICMDQCMFEVDKRTYRSTGRIDPQIGDEVIVVGNEGDAFVTIDEMADTLNTIPYELIIGFGSSRLPKVYV